MGSLAYVRQIFSVASINMYGSLRLPYILMHNFCYSQTQLKHTVSFEGVLLAISL